MFMKKTIDKIPPKLQFILILQSYDLQMKYISGKYMYLADTLSRAYVPQDNDSALEEKFEYVVHSVVKNLHITISKLDEFKEATALDSTLQTVIRYCQNGWPRTQHNVPIDARKYWHIRDTL